MTLADPVIDVSFFRDQSLAGEPTEVWSDTEPDAGGDDDSGASGDADSNLDPPERALDSGGAD